MGTGLSLMWDNQGGWTSNRTSTVLTEISIAWFGGIVDGLRGAAALENITGCSPGCVPFLLRVHNKISPSKDRYVASSFRPKARPCRDPRCVRCLTNAMAFVGTIDTTKKHTTSPYVKLDEHCTVQHCDVMLNAL